MFLRLAIAAPLCAVIFLTLSDAQEDNLENQAVNTTLNGILEATCTIGNKTYTGDACLETLGKFGRVVMWIVTGFLLIVFACCCGCICCICKIFYCSKNRGGQVISQPHNPVIATVT